MPGPAEESERGAPPVLELLGVVPRVVARRLHHIYADRVDRYRATSAVIAEVFLALADTPSPTPELVRSVALKAAQRIETEEKRHRRRVTGNDDDLAGVPSDGEADARREHRADVTAWWRLVVKHLEPDDVAALELRLEEVDDAEAAARLGWSESKLRKRRSRAYARIREHVSAGALPYPPGE